MGFFSRKKEDTKTFEEDYRERLLRGIRDAENEIDNLTEDAEELAIEIQQAIVNRQALVDERTALCEFVNKQRKALGLEPKDFDAEQTEEAAE